MSDPCVEDHYRPRSPFPGPSLFFPKSTPCGSDSVCQTSCVCICRSSQGNPSTQRQNNNNRKTTPEQQRRDAGPNVKASGSARGEQRHAGVASSYRTSSQEDRPAAGGRGQIHRPVSSGINRHRSCCRPAQLQLKQEDREREKRFCSELSRPNLHIPVISAFRPTSTLTENCVLSSWGVSSV